MICPILMTTGHFLSMAVLGETNQYKLKNFGTKYDIPWGWASNNMYNGIYNNQTPQKWPIPENIERALRSNFFCFWPLLRSFTVLALHTCNFSILLIAINCIRVCPLSIKRNGFLFEIFERFHFHMSCTSI